MMSKIYKSLYILILLTLFVSVESVDEFVIEDIRVEGLKRITPGTVFNYLPMKVGDKSVSYTHLTLPTNREV